MRAIVVQISAGMMGKAQDDRRDRGGDQFALAAAHRTLARVVDRRSLVHTASTPSAQSTIALADSPMNEQNPKPSTIQPAATVQRLIIYANLCWSQDDLRLGQN